MHHETHQEDDRLMFYAAMTVKPRPPADGLETVKKPLPPPFSGRAGRGALGVKGISARAATPQPPIDDCGADGTMDGHDIAALYERHAPAIYAHCRRLLGSAPAGRDALQESFVRVLQHHRVLGPGDQALRYLYRTSTNVCINLLRQRSVRERAAPLIAAQINAAQSNQPVPGDREFVRVLLDQCDETAVAVALMHFIDGMTQVEVAATLGITRRTVYNRIRKIERLAADMLEPTVTAPANDAEMSGSVPATVT